MPEVGLFLSCRRSMMHEESVAGVHPTDGRGGRVALLTYGTRGDVEPFLALGAGLQRAGFAPRLAAPGIFETLARNRHVDFLPLPGDPAQLARDLVALAGTSWPRMVAEVSRHVAPLGAEVSHLAAECAAGAELIVHSFLMTQIGHEMALQARIPSISAQLFPVFAPTSAFPSVVSPDLPLGGLYRRLTHAFVTQVFWQGSRILYGRLRRMEPSLPPLSGWPFAARRTMRPLLLFAFSRHVLPPPADWAGIAEVTGYWPLHPLDGWRPPAELERFLDVGQPPVYIGLGSGGEAARGGWIHRARTALEETGLRGILDLGEGGVVPGPLPKTMLAVRDVPHAWLFPRVAAVVHHGGAGTTGAGLTAGRVTVVVPTTSDQPFWGCRVHALGVGPKPIPVRRLNAEDLAQAVSVATTDKAMMATAEELGRRLRSEDGVGAAVDRIALMLGKRSTT
jgi:sterol 3beta-glucosyltransferase